MHFFHRPGQDTDNVAMCIFYLALRDKAHYWILRLPARSITQWGQLEKLFINKFFTPARTAKFRNDILHFKTKANEKFYQSWERFKELQCSCPHHGFELNNLVKIFQDSLTPDLRMIVSQMTSFNILEKTLIEL